MSLFCKNIQIAFTQAQTCCEIQVKKVINFDLYSTNAYHMTIYKKRMQYEKGAKQEPPLENECLQRLMP